MRYRVVEPSSHYFGQVGEEMEATGEHVMGRTDEWYAYWDVLLDLVPQGVGFKFAEIKEAECI